MQVERETENSLIFSKLMAKTEISIFFKVWDSQEMSGIHLIDFRRPKYLCLLFSSINWRIHYFALDFNQYIITEQSSRYVNVHNWSLYHTLALYILSFTLISMQCRILDCYELNKPIYSYFDRFCIDRKLGHMKKEQSAFDFCAMHTI